MRGEDCRHLYTAPHAKGSPPHARGRQRELLEAMRDRRITPACAGKTTREAVTLSAKADHPRMRGEDGGLFGLFWGLEGSPPHARGRLGDAAS